MLLKWWRCFLHLPVFSVRTLGPLLNSSKSWRNIVLSAWYFMTFASFMRIAWTRAVFQKDTLLLFGISEITAVKPGWIQRIFICSMSVIGVDGTFYAILTITNLPSKTTLDSVIGVLFIYLFLYFLCSCEAPCNSQNYQNKMYLHMITYCRCLCEWLLSKQKEYIIVHA